MRTFGKTIFGLLVIAGLVSILTSCQESANTNFDTTSSADQTIAENSFNDLFKVVEEAEQSESETMEKAGIHNWTFGDCASVTIDPVGPNFPKTITIDFGDTNCVASNGTERRGKIIATITGRLWQEGSMRTITTEDYYVNDARVEGTKTITNQGRNEEDLMYFTIVVEDGRITDEDGQVIEWNSTREKVWIEGEGTSMYGHGIGGVLDDVFLITGNGSGINHAGQAYTMSITKPLRLERSCRWITEGTIEVIPEGEEARILDYGDGDCDNIATVTIGDEVREIRIRRKGRF